MWQLDIVWSNANPCKQFLHGAYQLRGPNLNDHACQTSPTPNLGEVTRFCDLF